LADELKPESGGDRIIPVVNHPFIYQIRIAQTSVNPYTVRIVNDLTHTAKATFSKVDHYLRFELSPVKPLVVIDPGHGGRDPGAVGRISNEKTVVLQISKRIADLLEKDERLDVYMTRSQDVFISLDERVAVANQLNADLFLSVHANAMPRSSTVGGTETFIHPSATHHFGQIVHKHLLQATRLTDRGLKTANFRVLRGIDMPAVLIEIAFMSNPQEERLLNDPAFQDRVARAIHNAIIEYLFGK
jgi:N-acetylmuramoyl-L-alanine amidase